MADDGVPPARAVSPRVPDPAAPTADPFIDAARRGGDMLHRRPATPQPWHFAWDGHRLEVRRDRRRAALLDRPVAGAAGWIAVGAACENIAIAACRHGLPATFTWFPDDADHDLAAVVTFVSTAGARHRPTPPGCSR